MIYYRGSKGHYIIRECLKCGGSGSFNRGTYVKKCRDCWMGLVAVNIKDIPCFRKDGENE
jgi:hypothetical protein